jgi:type I restriction enzyme, R subunit
MSFGPEFAEVEQPFVDQLVDLGWKFTTGNLDDPTPTGRESFREVLLLADLKAALQRNNLDADSKPWLDDARLVQATNALKRLGTSKLLEANQKATELLLKGTQVDGVDGWDQGRQQTVHFIDWDDPANNTFRAVTQFQVACPTGQTDQHIRPDIVLFCNGIPLVVVECKSPYLATPLESAVDQLQRYANRRRGLGIVDCDEGNEQLFHYSQFVVGTCGEQARVGTFSAQAVHFLEWKDTSPVPLAEVAAHRNKAIEELSSQEKLVAGMLRPAHLLDIVRHFTLFMEAGGRTFKIVSRYQQFRAVHAAIERLRTGKTRAEDGEQDRRGGIVWHTQGSGKSLTMVFLIRKMRSMAELRRFKVVVVTDRIDLQKQLSDTATLTDEVLTIVKPQKKGAITVSSTDVLKEVLARKGKDLVFAMIQKYRGEVMDGDARGDEDEAEDDYAGDGGEAQGTAPPTKMTPLPELNADEEILVLVDEAHRSHTNTAHANLMQALPNCAKIGFTGTPIIMRDKGKTTAIFGSEIDRYTIRESEADGSTVPILYEGRTSQAAVRDGGELDELFPDLFQNRTPEELEAIQKKYATKGHVMEAEALIEAKARSMLRHYVENVLPNGFKAQIVAVSRRAAIRYFEKLQQVRDELVTELQGLDPVLLGLDDDEVAARPKAQAFLVRAHRFLPTIAALEFAPVISGGHNDSVDPEGKWSTRAQIDARIARFKKPLFAAGPNTFDGKGADPMAFLIVKSMLLTGFDAPIEQVMYLDRSIREAELLQAIARVNRTYARGGVAKACGMVVDYYGVARHLKTALAAYNARDVEGALESLNDEVPKLRDRHRRAIEVLRVRGVEDIDDIEACVQVLGDEKVRAEFHVKLKQFLLTLDLVLPRPEGLPFVNDAKTLAHIQARARNRYRSEQRLIGKEVGEKVRKLIDEHIVSLGIDPKIPPIEITSADFSSEVDKERSPRAKASEMEHALRYHLRKHFDEDPVRYKKLSDRLIDILKKFAGQWDELAKELEGLVGEATAGRGTDAETGLDEVQGPFYDLLVEEVASDDKPSAKKLATLRALTIAMVEQVRAEVSIVGFWSKSVAQSALRGWIFRTLDDANALPFDRLDAVADKLMELAKANHDRLVK